jgi:phosphohistidine phosphatase
VKRLILLRHAKSSTADGGLPDEERPLSDRGERDAPRMGARLHERGIHPNLVVSSPALRAKRTARLVAGTLDYPADEIRLDPALYLAAPEEILTVVAAQPDTIDCLLVVGHNPGLTELTNVLVPGLDLKNLPTAGTVVVDCAIERWADVRTARPRLRYYDYPKSPGAGVTID